MTVRSPAGSGSRASHQAAARPDHSASIPSADELRDHLSLKDAVRVTLARQVNRPRHVSDILEGKWDDTPAFRKLFGEMWLREQGSEA